jgi:hypothetical protein
MRIKGRWLLGCVSDERGQELDPWSFLSGRSFKQTGLLQVPATVLGRALDFSRDITAVPIVHGRMVELFERLGVQEVQFLPVQVGDHPGPWFILNALRIVPCIDDARCQRILKWAPHDGEPEKVGRYRAVHGLRIDSTKVGDARVFRPWGWTVALVVSEEIKQAMEKEAITGAKFIEV